VDAAIFMFSLYLPLTPSESILNCNGYSVNGLLMLHGAIRDALGVDDNTPAGNPKVYEVREHADWRVQSTAIEKALVEKSAKFTPIPW